MADEITGWFAEFFSTLNATLQKPEAMLSSFQTQQATLAVELTQAVAVMGGHEHPKGSLQSTLKHVLGSLVAEHIQEGQLVAAMQKATATMSGYQKQGGTLNVDLAHVVANLTGEQEIPAVLHSNLIPVLGSMNGFMIPEGPIVGLMQKPIASLSGKHWQQGTLAGQLIKPHSVLLGTHSQRGNMATILKFATATMFASHVQRGQVVASMKKMVASLSGSFTGVTPITYRAIGSVGSETTGNPSCTTHSSTATNDDVVCLVLGGTGSFYNATFGAGNTKMKFLGRVRFNGCSIAAFGIKNVASGSSTINISRTGSSWSQAVAISYTDIADFKISSIATGSGTSLSHSVSPGSGALIAQCFGNGDTNVGFSGLSGGTNRVNENSGFTRQTVSETNTSLSFTATQSSSQPWGSLAVQMVGAALSGPRINDLVVDGAENNGGTINTSIEAATGDYGFFVLIQNVAGDPSSVTCAGSAMTLIDTVTCTTTVGTGFAKIYRTSSTFGSGGSKSISCTTTGSGWLHWLAFSASGISSISAATKTNATGSTMSQSATCNAGELILQVCVTSASISTLGGGCNFYDCPASSQCFGYMNLADASTTFTSSNSLNWGSMYIVLA